MLNEREARVFHGTVITASIILSDHYLSSSI
jgi:hypothetical protein